MVMWGGMARGCFLRGDENILKTIGVRITQLSEYTKKKIDAITLIRRILWYVNYISIKLLKKCQSLSVLFLTCKLVTVRGGNRLRGKLGTFLPPFWRSYRILTHQETSQPRANTPGQVSPGGRH